jgi:quinol-cytochrome oxidoreductase complex cytochrome b subunit
MNAIFGFFIFLTIANQIISGIMLSFSLIPEAMLTAPSREEEDIENMYTDDFF